MAGIRVRSIPTMHPFRPAEKLAEAVRAQDALDAAVAAGDDTLARVIAASIRASAINPNEVGIMRSLRALEREPMEVLPQATFEDMAQDIGKSVRSYEGMISGRTGNLKNQWRGDIGGRELRAAAQEAIQSAAAARQAERMGTAAAIAGAAGLGGMIAETTGRLPGDAAGVANAPAPDPLMDYVAPEVDMLPVDDMPIPQEQFAPVQLPEMGLTDFSPMETADLVAEQRPIPASTPTAMPEMLTPEEIAALRGQVVSIRDAKTGQAMDSFYPPESEEYKREQRMKLRYPQMRR